MLHLPIPGQCSFVTWHLDFMCWNYITPKSFNYCRRAFNHLQPRDIFKDRYAWKEQRKTWLLSTAHYTVITPHVTTEQAPGSEVPCPRRLTWNCSPQSCSGRWWTWLWEPDAGYARPGGILCGLTATEAHCGKVQRCFPAKSEPRRRLYQDNHDIWWSCMTNKSWQTFVQSGCTLLWFSCLLIVVYCEAHCEARGSSWLCPFSLSPRFLERQGPRHREPPETTGGTKPYFCESMSWGHGETSQLDMLGLAMFCQGSRVYTPARIPWILRPRTRTSTTRYQRSVWGEPTQCAQPTSTNHINANLIQARHNSARSLKASDFVTLVIMWSSRGWQSQ